MSEGSKKECYKVQHGKTAALFRLFSTCRFLQQDVRNLLVQSTKTFQEAKLLKLEELKRLGDLLQVKSTSEAFTMSIQNQMEKISSEMSNDVPPLPTPQRNQIPLAQEKQVVLLSPHQALRLFKILHPAAVLFSASRLLRLRDVKMSRWVFALSPNS